MYNSGMEQNDSPKKKPGRKPGPPMKTTSVAVPPSLLAWATKQPGGFAAIVRDCLEQRYKQASGQAAATE